MPEDPWIERVASGNERRHNHALAAAILILTYHADPSEPETVRCGRIAELIHDTMQEAEAELTRAWLEPNVN